ncbi:MAG: hypothetical protein IJ629_01795 [Clostridia bacterium]|nr:hypothetical protein [Clostridia bacterium]
MKKTLKMHLKEIKRAAKAGKSSTIQSVYPTDLVDLAKKGFEISPWNQYNLALISWHNAERGTAKRMRIKAGYYF